MVFDNLVIVVSSGYLCRNLCNHYMFYNITRCDIKTSDTCDVEILLHKNGKFLLLGKLKTLIIYLCRKIVWQVWLNNYCDNCGLSCSPFGSVVFHCFGFGKPVQIFHPVCWYLKGLLWTFFSVHACVILSDFCCHANWAHKNLM